MPSKTPSPPGNFSYPPPGSSLHFDYVDSLITSWLTFDPNVTDCLLSIWYWPQVDPWKIGMLKFCLHFCLWLESRPRAINLRSNDDKMLIKCLNHVIGYNWTAPANGTQIVPLNLARRHFLGQLNFSYHASDGSPQIFLSPTFSVDNSPQSKPVTWSQGEIAAPTPSPSAVTQTSILASLLTSGTSTASAASSTSSISKPSSTSGSRLATGAAASAAASSPSISKPTTPGSSRLGTSAIAGIVVGIVVCVGLAAALVFYRRRKPKKVQAEVKTPSSARFQSPIPVHIIVEKDATPLHPPELSGDGQLVEMATGYHGEMNVSTGRA